MTPAQSTLSAHGATTKPEAHTQVIMELGSEPITGFEGTGSSGEQANVMPLPSDLRRLWFQERWHVLICIAMHREALLVLVTSHMLQ